MAQEELPRGVTGPLDVIVDLLGQIARGAEWHDVLPILQVELENAVIGASWAAEGHADPSPRDPVEIGAVVAANVRALRLGADWTQAAVAEAMARVGFDWKRITVAEVESGGRRLQLEELMAIAGLYGVPVVELLVPDHDQPVAWRDRPPLPASTVTELMCGPGAPVSLPAGPDWRPAVLLCGSLSGRPAEDYWQRSMLHRLGRRTTQEAGR